MQGKVLFIAAALLAMAHFWASQVYAEAGTAAEHTPPVQVYQGAPFRLQVTPLAAAKKMVAHLNLAGLELVQPMRSSAGRFLLDVPGKLTKERRGPVSYYIEAFGADGQVRQIRDPAGNPFRTKIVPAPAAVLLHPNGQATMDAFTVSISLNEAFAIVPADSFQITFAGKDVRSTMVCTDRLISFPVGPGLRNGIYAIKFSTKAVPGWKEFKKSWTIRLHKAPSELTAREGPLTITGSAARSSADLDETHLPTPVRAGVSWDGLLFNVDALCITPQTSALTLAETPLFGVKAGFGLGPIGVELTEGVTDVGSAETYPRFALTAAVDLGDYSLNLAAVVDDQSFSGPEIYAQQSYVASLSADFGGNEPGQVGAAAEIACGLSFPYASGHVDWALVQSQAGLPDASRSLKLLALLQPVLKAFPIPNVDETLPLTLPETGLAYRLSAWGPIGKTSARIEYSKLEEGFLSLGSPLFPGQTAVLMVALDPERPATKPFAYDPGPVGDRPAEAARTYGVHFTGLGFDVAGDPARLGFDYFSTTWAGGAHAKTYRLLAGYYTYADLDFVLEGCADGGARFYGLEATATRKIGRTTLALTGGYHTRNSVSSYGFGVDLKYASGWGLLATFDLLYGDPYAYAAEPRAIAAVTGVTLNF